MPSPELPDDIDDDIIDGIRDWVVDRTVLTMPGLDWGTNGGDGDGGTSGGTSGGPGNGPGSGPDEPEIDLPKDPQEPPITSQRSRAPTARAGTTARLGRTRVGVLSSAIARTRSRPTATSVLATVRGVSDDAIRANLRSGRVPYVIKTATGGTTLTFADVGTIPSPAIYLVETYRMSNFLGDYGAGRTVGTFSLLPGEKTKISITTYKSSTTTEATTSSIFDSYTTTAEDTLESTIQSESSDAESKDKTTEWNVEAEASGNWGVASASVSGGASGSTNTAREEFSKNVSTATEKHAQTASAQRDVTVNSTSTSTVETGEETAIEREITNINVSRALNFVTRQLNQQHISLLHLVDVRVAFWNGYVDMKLEVPIHDLDKLLDYCVRNAADRTTIKADVLFALKNIYDYENKVQNLLQAPPRKFTERDGTTRTIETIDRTKQSVYEPEGRNITVDGVIMSARTVVLRTDAVIVEALLGQANALDDYSIGLQVERVREKQLANDAAALSLDERGARLSIVATKDKAAAEVWAAVFAEGLVEAEPMAGVTPVEGGG